VLKEVNAQDIPHFGLVLEANMVGEDGGELDCLSGGWVEIDGQTNTSVGYMTFDPHNITPFDIAGSDRWVIRGEDPKPFLALADERFHDEARALEIFKKANPLLPLRATRRNYNFMRGCFEIKDGTRSTSSLRASEHTFRPGGATGAELLAKGYLDGHPEATMVHTRSQVHYGDPREATIPPHATVIYEGTYSGRGRYQDYIEVPATVFAQVIEAS
jgi:hypothetical protein